jgi:hypothetical protein
MQGLWKKLPFALIVVAATLCVAGVAIATTSSDNGTTARSAQEPLGDNSAISPDNQQGAGEVEAKENDQATPSGDGGGGGSAGTQTVSSGGSSRLPFSGFLAIPVLLIGAGLLATGVGLRRRTATS